MLAHLTKQLPGWTPLLLVLLLQLLVRMPLLTEGYGIEEDSYGHVLHTQELHQTGTYSVSRLPGHPVYEGLLYLLSFLSYAPIIFNGLSAFFGLLGLYFFYKIYCFYKFPFPYLATTALGLVPVYLLSSTYTIDYVVALALVLGSYYALLQKRWLLAAVVLGLAAGVRLTALAMGLPFFLMIWDFSGQKRQIFQALGFAMVTFVTAAICYLPPYWSLGWAFFDTYDLPWPPVPKILYKASIGAFGLMGVLALALTLGHSVWERLMGRKVLGADAPAVHTFAWVITLLLYVVAYARVPEKSAFVLPMLPFIFLFAAFWMPRQRLRLFYFLMLPASFVMGINLTDETRGVDCGQWSQNFVVSNQEICMDPLQGPLFHELSKRKNKTAYAKRIVAAANALPDSTVIIAGWWQGLVLVELQASNNRPDLVWAYYLPEATFTNFLKAGRPIYYLTDQAAINDRKYNNKQATTHAQHWQVAP
jgi:hypothetical protein